MGRAQGKTGRPIGHPARGGPPTGAHSGWWRRPEAPQDASRIAYGYLAAMLAGLVGPAALLLLPALTPAACSSAGDGLCEVGLMIWLVTGGFLLALTAATWFFGMGWVFLLTFAAQLMGLFRLADVVQTPWLLVLVLVVPAISAVSSVRWTEPVYKGWQFWLALGVSGALIAAFGAWLLS